MLRGLTLLITALVTLGALIATTAAQAFDTRATAAYAIDVTTGTVLLDKNASEPLPPASMSKLMTLYMAFEAVGDGRLQLDEKLPVSQHAMSYGGSTMFLNTRDRVTVEDLLRGIIVLSGNDACAVIAEALSPDGTEAGFARMMTERGKRMGLTNSNFTNSNGWPAAGHRMSMKDLVIVSQRLIGDFPTFYPLFAEREFLFDSRAPKNKNNRNPLLRLNIGADGLKTGHTQEAGYGLVGSAKQGDRRVIFALTGLQSEAARAEEAERLVTWSFRQFAEKSVAKAGERISTAEIWNGDVMDVGLVAQDDLNILVPVFAEENLNAQVIYDGPITAPIRKGDPLAELVIEQEGLPRTTVPLLAETDVPKGGFTSRVRTAAFALLRQLTETPAP
ncbi:MAG: D-alanyl-D-alanine carboxypeptidase family protein [Pseudomonadota bacterium]